VPRTSSNIRIIPQTRAVSNPAQNETNSTYITNHLRDYDPSTGDSHLTCSTLSLSRYDTMQLRDSPSLELASRIYSS